MDISGPGRPSSVDPAVIEELVKKCIEAKENAYAPYSNFRVGAAILAYDGSIYTGMQDC